MILRVLGHGFHFETENLCRTFFVNDKIEVVRDTSGEDSRTVVTALEGENIRVECCIDGKKCTAYASLAPEQDPELFMAQLLFRVLKEITGYTPPWGILTGVRPSKLMTKLVNDMGEERARQYFKDGLYVTPGKIDLACTVAEKEKDIIALSRPDSFSLYISIPFCPSRCSYCSFVSHSITSPAAKKMVPEYLERLCGEIKEMGGIAKELHLRLESIYFGGGTPGVLAASQLDTLCNTIAQNFDLSALREYTVECGRPDTVTLAKLRTLKMHGVGRISINPQTFSQEVLDAVGRKHTVEQALSAYKLARGVGFDCINMDLIAGLTGDTVEGFCASVDTAVTLAPENITVHTLALKRSSEMAEQGAKVAEGNDAKKMLEYAQKRLVGAGYVPYYMYRQSKCVGNLENVGWAKPGKECLYNVFMMEECHTVLAAGAGAVTKLKAPHGDYIERIFNFKYPYEYIARYDELTQRKAGINAFYSTYSMDGE